MTTLAERPVRTQYEDLLRHVLENGTRKSDRTGTGTRSVFGAQMRFDLSEGFPLVTTKQVHLKSIVYELLWFLRGDTNVRWLQERGVKIWDEWRRPYTLSRETVIVAPRPATPGPDFTGPISYAGNHFVGEDRKLADTWIRMMQRCYEPSHHRYALYGGSGATVHPDWHDPAEFVRAAKLLPHWRYKQEDWNGFELDKDYYGSGQYGPDTAVWLSSAENNLYTRVANPVKVTDERGEQRTYITQAIAAKAIGMPTSTFSRLLKSWPTMLKGANRAFIGWELESVEVAGLLRLALIEDGDRGPIYGAQWRSWPSKDGRSIDQISAALETLKTNPDSRRIIVSAWNPDEVDDMALPPCHAMFQFHVSDGKLSCQLYQRSADLLLGVPFNIASYALLTHMFAQQAGLEVGEFIWTGGDCHIYDNHVDQVTEQLSREPYPYPVLELAKADSLFEYDLPDVVVTDYRHHPKITAPVAV